MAVNHLVRGSSPCWGAKNSGSKFDLTAFFIMWYVYICDKKGKLYTGITIQIPHRMHQHKATLLYYEAFDGKHAAAKREREIKGWTRAKKLALIDNSR